MPDEIQVRDAMGAQNAARRYIASLHDAQKIKNISFSRTWYQAGAKMDLWEVEGDILLQTGLLSKTTKHFKCQIEPAEGRVIAFDG